MTHRDTFFACPPRFFAVEYVINPWMDGNIGRADRQRANEQWTHFLKILSEHATVELIDPQPGLPDMTFTANAGFLCGDVFVPTRFRVTERTPEIPHFTEWFRARGFRVLELSGNLSFEGEGDALFQPGTNLLWGGYGVRTTLHAYRLLAELLDVQVVPLRLIDQRFYHLDTCFCPLPGNRLLYYPPAFDRRSLAAIAERIPAECRLEIDTEDAMHFACNAIFTTNTLILPFASERLRGRLRDFGFNTEVCPLGEFLLAGGAAKCLVLRQNPHLSTVQRWAGPPAPALTDRIIDLEGHLLDRGEMSRVLDQIEASGAGFEIEQFQPGLRHDQRSFARLRLTAADSPDLDQLLGCLMELGARVSGVERDARLETVEQPGVAPDTFYSTTIYPTEVRIHGRWVRVRRQRMDAVLVVKQDGGDPTVECVLIRDLRPGDRVVCGVDGVRVHVLAPNDFGEKFGFMSARVSSERRVELAVERLAWEMRQIRARSGKIVVVSGPVTIHTGAGPHLASLIRNGYVQALLAGNGFAAHDIESALFGTALGVDLQRGVPVPSGHQHHLRAINSIRRCGSIARAVEQGVLRSGVMYECVKHHVPFALAGSIRDDGPLPDTLMDLVEAQRVYERLLEGADMILMLSTMLHAIGVGNMTPAGVRLVCVDINPAVVTKLTDRGSMECTGLVTDVGLILNLLVKHLLPEELRERAARHRGTSRF